MSDTAVRRVPRSRPSAIAATVDDDREGVDEETEQRGVDALERGEVRARLGAVADGAERERDADVAPGHRPYATGRAGGEEREPEEQRGEDEAPREERPDGRALAVRELAEDPHRAERGRGGETEDDAGGRHAPILPPRSSRIDSDS